MTLAHRLLAGLTAAVSLSACQKVSDVTVGPLVHGYLMAHPEVLREASEKLAANDRLSAQKASTDAIAKYRSQLERDPRDFVANPNGKVTVVEFFDYRCGYCKLAAPEVVKLIEETARAHRVSAILVEDKGSGTQYIQSRQGLAPAPIISINVGHDSKQFRFDGVVPMFEAGEVLLPRVAGWLPDYVRELLTFPDATHDDQVDSTSQYLSWTRRGRTGGTKKMTGMGNASQADIRAALEAGRGATPTVNRIG